MFCFGFGFSFCIGGIFGAVKTIHCADNYKNRESNNEKVDNVLDEVTVSDVGGGFGAEDVWDINGEAREVKAASNEASDRHNNVVDEGINNSGESATDGDTDSEINDGATVDKFFEFLDKRTVFKRFFRGLRCVHRGIIAWFPLPRRIK